MLPHASLPLRILWIGLALASLPPRSSRAEEAPSDPRRPVAIAARKGLLYAANRDTGTVSVADAKAGAVVEERRLAGRLSDLALFAPTKPGARATLFLADPEAGQLLWLDLEPDGRLAPRTTRRELAGAERLALHTATGQLAVSSRRARTLRLFTLEEVRANPEAAARTLLPRQRARLALPFVPLLAAFHPRGHRLVVTDAFGGELALVDTESPRVLAHRSIEGHNIRGLALNEAGEVLVAHQILNARAETDRSRVFWGTVQTNVLRSLDLAELESTARHGSPAASSATKPGGRSGSYLGPPIGHWRLYPLGEPGRAAGDPRDIAILPGGEIAVTLGGVDRIALLGKRSGPPRLVPTGRRPTGLAFDRETGLLVTASTFSDSLTLADPGSAARVREVSLGPHRPLTAAERGESHFRDAKLSLDGWYSCNSCHVDGHTSGGLNDNLDDESFGTPKRIPSLHGVGATAPYGWLGLREKLEDQVRLSVRFTLRGDEPDLTLVSELTAFLRSLEAPPKPGNLGPGARKALRERGAALFRSEGCADCHRGRELTSSGRFRVGLEDEAGRRAFNPPSLRGVGERRGLFHDGRAPGLREVLEDYRHPLGQDAVGAGASSAAEIDALVAYLESL